MKNANGQNSSMMLSASDSSYIPNYMTWEKCKIKFKDSLLDGGYIDKNGNDTEKTKRLNK